MDRDEMLKREDEAWRALTDAIESMPVERRDEQGVVPGWSTHDILWHCAYWAADGGDSLERSNGGDRSESPAPPEADVVAQGRAMSWSEAMAKAEEARRRIRTALEACPDVDDWVIEAFAGETYEHYDEHAAEVRAFIS